MISSRVNFLIKGSVWGALLLGFGLLLGGCNSLFYYPDQIRYSSPEQYNLWHEEVNFTSQDGTRLHGWFIKAAGRPKGTIVYFHGNGTNITDHISFVRWLPKAGYSVFLFDYRGYGRSGGTPDRGGVIEDGVAAINYVRGRKDVNSERLVIYGQSLGGAVAISALARAGHLGVSALVAEGAFHSYREVVRMKLADSVLTWMFQYPVAYLLFSGDYDPIEDMPVLFTVPFLVIHGEKDSTVPLEAGQALFDGFVGIDREMWVIPGGRHLAIFTPTGSPWRQKLLKYLEDKVGILPPPGYQLR